MKTRYLVKPLADRDLDDHADFLTTEVNLELGLRFLAAAHDTFALLATQPNMGWRSQQRRHGIAHLRIYMARVRFDRFFVAEEKLNNNTADWKPKRPAPTSGR